MRQLYDVTSKAIARRGLSASAWCLRPLMKEFYGGRHNIDFMASRKRNAELFPAEGFNHRLSCTCQNWKLDYLSDEISAIELLPRRIWSMTYTVKNNPKYSRQNPDISVNSAGDGLFSFDSIIVPHLSLRSWCHCFWTRLYLRLEKPLGEGGSCVRPYMYTTV